MTLSIGGVPEHFNLPWYRAIAQQQFEQAGISVNWTDYPGGTGAMMQDLRNGNLEVAVALTEGVVAEIVNQQSCRILQLYVESPLIWGIHVSGKASWQKIEDLKGKRYAISRLGSGSHLMAFVHAQQQGWDPQELSFVTVGNLEGARKVLATEEADVFMWEKFMTKPLVDSGEFRRIGECPTPWPCFVIAASEQALVSKAAALQKMLSVIRQACREFMEHPEAVQLVADRFHFQLEDAQTWFHQTRWATNPHLSRTMLQQVLNTLYEVGTIPEKTDPDQLCRRFSDA